MDAAAMAAVDANVAEWSADACGGEVVDARRAADAAVAVDAAAAAPPLLPPALTVCACIAAAAAAAGIASAACCNSCCASRVWSRAWSGAAPAPRDDSSGSRGGGGPAAPAAIQAEVNGGRVEDAEAALAGIDVAAATLPGDRAAALIDAEAADETTATADADEAASPLAAAID